MEVMTPALQLISHSMRIISPGLIRSTQASWLESAYFRLPCLVMVRVIEHDPFQAERLLQVVAPGQQHALHMAHCSREQQGQRNRDQQLGEHPGDDVEAARLEDRVPQPGGG